MEDLQLGQAILEKLLGREPKHQTPAELVQAAVRTLKGQWPPHSLKLLQEVADGLRKGEGV